MMHPHTELRFIDPAMGYGVFATQFIPKGTITWVLDDLDQRLDEAYVKTLDPLRRERVLKYSYRDRAGKYVLCWDIARYVNHSFHANCVSTAYEFELATRDIYPGEELTDDYGYLNLDEPFYCFREKGAHRTKVMPDDLLHFYAMWDAIANDAMQQFNHVQQPLRDLIDPEFSDRVAAIANGLMPLDSILNCYYDRAKTDRPTSLNLAS